MKTITTSELDTVIGGIGKAVQIWGQHKTGVRATLDAQGVLRLFLPKTKVIELGGKTETITSRGEYKLTPKEPYQH